MKVELLVCQAGDFRFDPGDNMWVPRHSPRSFVGWHFDNVGSSQRHAETLAVTRPAKRSDRQIFKCSRIGTTADKVAVAMGAIDSADRGPIFIQAD